MLTGWAASPARLREDANAEEDAALGPYRDRLLVELLQNAADAAAAAGAPGRVLIRLRARAGDPPVLEVANTGAALTAEGVQALSTLRASAKRHDPAGRGDAATGHQHAGTVGRFGVGFAAVVAATPEPVIASRRTGGVRWSRDAATAAVAALPALAGERARRGAALPLLRLPFPVEQPVQVPEGYDTVVVLPLTDPALADADSVRQMLASLDPTLLLVLPGLAEVRIDDGAGPERVVSCTWDGDDAVLDGTRWTGATLRGAIPPELLAGRPVEERERTGYEVRVLAPEGPWPATAPRVLRAPQPTDEPLGIPALVSVPVPLDPGRRRVQDGPLTTWLLDRAAETLVTLAVRTGDLDLIPTGLPEGPVDAALTDRLRELLPAAPMLLAASGEQGGRLAGRAASVLDLGDGGIGRVAETVTGLLADAAPGLLPAGLAAPSRASTLRVLGVRRVGVRGLVELVAGLHRPPHWWARLYAALADLPARVPERDALGTLPVPLVDGRTVHGTRGVLLPTAALADALAGPGAGDLIRALALRVAHAEVAAGSSGELLRQLGAADASPRELLEAVLPLLPNPDAPESALDDDAPPAEAVLALVAAADLAPGALPGLGALLLRADDGELWPAQELVLPGSPLALVLTDDAPFGVLDAALAGAWPARVLEAVGVLRTFAVLRAGGGEPAGDESRRAGQRNARDAGGVVLDPDEPLLLELDGSDRWLEESDAPAVVDSFVAVRDLELVRWPEALALLATRELRAAVLASDYTRWWLSTHPVLGGLLPGETALPHSQLAALYDAVPAGVPKEVDEELLVAIGVRSGAEAILADPDATLDLLDRLGEPERDAPWPLARGLYVKAARALGGIDPDPPLRVRTPGGVVPAAAAVVVDSPDLLALLGGRPAVRVPLEDAAAVARVLGVPLASSLGPYELVSTAPLCVRDLDGEVQAVAWFGEHVDPAADPTARGRALAWRSRHWPERHTLAARLTATSETARSALDAEDDLDPLAGSPHLEGSGPHA